MLSRPDQSQPVQRFLCFCGMALVTLIHLAQPVFAETPGIAMPSMASDAQAAPVPVGQGQSAYPTMNSAATSASLPPTTIAPDLSQTQLPSVAASSNAIVQPDGKTNGAAPPPKPTAAPLPSPALMQPSPPPAPAASVNGIDIPSPPPPSAFSTDPNQLANQAEIAAMQAQAQADAEEMKREREHNVKSYDKAAAGLLPLSPDQVRDFMHKLEQTQNAAQFPYEGTPKGQTRITTVSLDPGVEPPQVDLATGYVTTIAMVDATGEPWPILDVGVGGNFEVSPTQAGTHVVRVMPLTRVGTGDLSVLLKDLPTPVIFRLSAGGPSVDLRYDARIGKPGPGAKPQIIARPRLEAGDETLTLILENAPPASAKRLKVGGLDARTKAWSVGDKVYVRTPLSLLSPAWNASVAAADGMTVYEIGNAPVLLMSDNGAMVRAQIMQDDDHDR